MSNNFYISELPFDENLKRFLVIYYKIQGKVYSVDDFAKIILTNRTRLAELFDDYELCYDSTLFKVHYYLVQVVDLSIIKGSEYERFLLTCRDYLIKDIVCEINRRISHKEFQRANKKDKKMKQ